MNKTQLIMVYTMIYSAFFCAHAAQASAQEVVSVSKTEPRVDDMGGMAFKGMQPRIRGMFGSRINLLEGRRYTMLGGCTPRVPIPPYFSMPNNFDNSTVVNAPQVINWGAGASGGPSAALMFMRPSELFEAFAIKSSASFGVGSNGCFDHAFNVAVGNEMGFVRFNGEYIKANDYKDGDGNKIPAKFEKWGGDLTLGLNPTESSSIVLTLRKTEDGKARLPDREMDYRFFKSEAINFKFSQRNIGEFLESVDLQTYYVYAEHVMDNYSRRVRPTIPVPVNAINPSLKIFGARLSSQWRLGENHTLLTGMDTQTDLHRSRVSFDFDSPRNKPWGKDLKFERYGLFGELTSRLSEDSQLTSGLRLDFYKVKDYRGQSESRDQSRTDTLPYGFLRFEQTIKERPIMWFVELDYVERLPGFWELNQNRVKNSVGNAFNLLKPERAMQLITGIEYRTEQLDVKLAGYVGQIKDYVLFSYGPGINTEVQNVDARTMGVELQVDYRFSDRWSLNSSVMYSWAKNTSDHEALAQVSPLEGRFKLNYVQENWRAVALWRVVAPQTRYALNKGDVRGKDFGRGAGFGTLSLLGNYTIDKSTKISAGVDNVFNKNYSEHLNTGGTFGWGPSAQRRLNEAGRTYWVRVNVDF